MLTENIASRYTERNMTIPKNKEELEAILARSFEFHATMGKPVVENYQTDKWQIQLKALKTKFLEDGCQEDDYARILNACKMLLTYSKHETADVFRRDLPTTEMYGKMIILFNDGNDLHTINKPKKIDVNYIESANNFKMPMFSIKSAQEHPNTPTTQTLFSLFGTEGQQYKTEEEF